MDTYLELLRDGFEVKFATRVLLDLATFCQVDGKLFRE